MDAKGLSARSGSSPYRGEKQDKNDVGSDFRVFHTMVNEKSQLDPCPCQETG